MSSRIPICSATSSFASMRRPGAGDGHARASSVQRGGGFGRWPTMAGRKAVIAWRLDSKPRALARRGRRRRDRREHMGPWRALRAA